MNNSFSMTSLLSLHMRCEELPLLQSASQCTRSDCFVVVYRYDEKNCEYHELGRTETIRNSLDPEWSSKVQVEHVYESGSEVKFEFYYQVTKDGKDLSKQLKIGYIKTELKHIKQAANGRICLDITPCDSLLEKYTALTQSNGDCDEEPRPPYVGKFYVRGIEVGNDLDLLNFQFTSKNINLKGHKTFKDPEKTVKLFFEVYQYQKVDDSYIKVYVSNPQPYIKKKGVDFGLLSIPMQKLCNTDRSLPLKFKFYIYDPENRGNSCKDDFIGAQTMSIEEFLDIGKKFKIRNEKGKRRGTIFVSCVKIVQRYSYLEFIRCGLDLNLTLAIDYTKSNGDVYDASGHHYVNTEDLNQYQYFNEYQQGIASIGKVLQEYSISQAITCLGFGAVLPAPYGNGCVSHRFPLKYDQDTESEESENIEQITDIDDILVQYQKVAEAVEMKGPSNFVPMLERVFDEAKTTHCYGEKKYSVFVILTDGDVDDMSDVKRLIIENSHLPVSIVMCGVGDEADHDNIKLLASYGDNERLNYNANGGKVYCKRNIVSYLRIKDFEKGKTPREDLAKAVLSVIPEQITSYFASVNIAPPALKDTNMSNLLVALKGGSARMRGAVQGILSQAVGDVLDSEAYNDMANNEEVKKAGNVVIRSLKTVGKGLGKIGRRGSAFGSKLSRASSRVASIRPRLSISASRVVETENETTKTELKIGAEVIGAGEAIIPTFDVKKDII